MKRLSRLKEGVSDPSRVHPRKTPKNPGHADEHVVMLPMSDLMSEDQRGFIDGVALTRVSYSTMRSGNSR